MASESHRDRAASVGRRVSTALRWMALARLAGQVATWSITIYVIRILSPEDYGLMSMATVLMGLAMLVNELGLVPALIQAKNADSYLVRQVFGAVLVFNILICCLLYFGAPAFAGFFEEDRLVPIIRVMALILPIASIGAVPSALLQRQIAFKGLATVQFVSMLIGSLTTLALALGGLGVWALVIGNAAMMVTKAFGAVIVCRFRTLPVFRFHGLRAMFGFGTKMTAQRIVWYGNSQLDVVMVGGLLGSQALGVYSVACHLATLPMTKLMQIVNQVALPAYSRLQDDTELAADYFFRALTVMSLVFFPLMWGLSSVSDEFVDVVLGDKWDAAKMVLRVVSLSIPLRMASMVLNPVVTGLGHPGIGLRNVLTFTAIMPVTIVAGLSWGLVGVSVGLVAGWLVAMLINFHRSLAVIGCGLEDLFAIMTPFALSAGVMYGAVTVTKFLLPAAVSTELRLIAMVAVGIATYAVLTWTCHRRSALQSMALIRAGA